MSPRLVVLAGPNGAGKTTFYEVHLKDAGLDFINADRISNLGVPVAEAAKAADRLRAEMLARRQSFITETVFSDPVGAKLAYLQAAMALGYHVTLHYVTIPSPELSAARVAQRVATGGHDVPEERLERRFRQSLENLRQALAFVPEAHVYDNSDDADMHRLVLSTQAGKATFIAKKFPAWLLTAGIDPKNFA